MFLFQLQKYTCQNSVHAKSIFEYIKFEMVLVMWSFFYCRAALSQAESIPELSRSDYRCKHLFYALKEFLKSRVSD